MVVITFQEASMPRNLCIEIIDVDILSGFSTEPRWGQE